MAITPIPISKGLGKSSKNADYVDLLPVNMLATPKEVLGAAGYMRSFPGLTKKIDVAGTSRGAQYNKAKNVPYRVLGNRLYSGASVVGEVVGIDRVSMAHSATSQAVAANGIMTLYRYDGTVKTLSNWPPDSEYPSYDIGMVTDICRNRGRYVWSQGDRFGVTDLEDESHPDRYRPFYVPESQPDGIQAVDVWRDYVVCFGTSTIEYFALTGAVDATEPIYVAQSSLMVDKGIAGQFCKCQFASSFAFISHESTGAPSVYVIDSGQAKQIATATVEKLLREYNTNELSTTVMEPLRFDSHELLLIHLPRHVLCYDITASQNSPQWSILKTGLSDLTHRAIDYLYSCYEFTAADKRAPLLGKLQFDSSAQYEQQAEHILYTAIVKADNVRIFDFELESSTGQAQTAENLFISATSDGINYGREQIIGGDAPFRYDRRVIWRKVARVRKNIGFKIRVVTRAPVTLSGCKVRIE